MLLFCRFHDVKNTNYQVNTWGGSTFETMMASSRNDGIRSLYETMTRSSLVSGEDEGRREIDRNPNILFFGAGLSFLGDPEIMVLNLQDAPKGHCTVAFSKNSEFTKLFNHHLIKMDMSGLSDKLWTRQFGIRRERTAGKRDIYGTDSDAKPLGYKNLLFPIMILIGGLFSSVLLLGFECFSAILK